MDRPFERPKAILYRFVDVLATGSRLKFDYVNITSDYLNRFIDEFYYEPEFVKLLEELRDMSCDDYAQTDRRCPLIFKPSQPQCSVRDSVSLYMNWRMKKDNKARLGAFRSSADNKLIRWVVAYGLANGACVTVHNAYAEALKQRASMPIAQYLYSRLTCNLVDGHRRLVALTSSGDLSQCFTAHLNPAMFVPTKRHSYVEMAKVVGVQPGQLMVVTTDLAECAAALRAGCVPVKVKRPNEPKNRTFPRVTDITFITFRDRVPSVAFTKPRRPSSKGSQSHNRRKSSSKGSTKSRSKRVVGRSVGGSSQSSLRSNKSPSKRRSNSNKSLGRSRNNKSEVKLAKSKVDKSPCVSLKTK